MKHRECYEMARKIVQTPPTSSYKSDCFCIFIHAASPVISSILVIHFRMPVIVYVKMLNLVIANANSMFLDVLYPQKPKNATTY
jgi:hypothetical protein